MSNPSVSRWMLLIVVLSMLIGIVGGGVMGGAVSYYVWSQNHSSVAVTTASQPQLAVSKSQNPAPATTNLSVTEDSAVIDTAKKASPAVVTVISTLPPQSNQGGRRTLPGPNPFNPNPSPSVPDNVAEGSGVIIDNQGHIITNNHVIDGAQSVNVVYSDGSKVSATVVGADSVSDIAVLQVTGKVPAALALGDSNALQLGESVIAIGSPLGSYRGSVTVGVVSGLNRSVDGSDQDGLIQTDAAINHGNSGGPLLNLAGQIVGINTLVVRDTTNGDVAEGLGFAIPSNRVATVVNQLIAGGKVAYPFIGITYATINAATSTQLNAPVQDGVIIQQVSPGTPAASAGLQTNDIITAIDGTALNETISLRSILFQHKVGDTITLTILRNGQTLSVKLTLVARPPSTSVGAPG